MLLHVLYKILVLAGSVSGQQRPDLSECYEKLEDPQGMAYFSCRLCGKSCSRKDSLMTHIENIHFPVIEFKLYFSYRGFNMR